MKKITKTLFKAIQKLTPIRFHVIFGNFFPTVFRSTSDDIINEAARYIYLPTLYITSIISRFIGAVLFEICGLIEDIISTSIRNPVFRTFFFSLFWSFYFVSVFHDIIWTSFKDVSCFSLWHVPTFIKTFCGEERRGSRWTFFCRQPSQVLTVGGCNYTSPLSFHVISSRFNAEIVATLHRFWNSCIHRDRFGRFWWNPFPRGNHECDLFK